MEMKMTQVADYLRRINPVYRKRNGRWVLAVPQRHTEAKSMDWSMDWSLVVVTGGLVWVGWRQINDARIWQRAYVSAVPGGIEEGRLILAPSEPSKVLGRCCAGTHAAA
jgi:hypothetical protein